MNPVRCIYCNTLQRVPDRVLECARCGGELVFPSTTRTNRHMWSPSPSVSPSTSYSLSASPSPTPSPENEYEL
jgi:hypothetical protein